MTRHVGRIPRTPFSERLRSVTRWRFVVLRRRFCRYLADKSGRVPVSRAWPGNTRRSSLRDARRESETTTRIQTRIDCDGAIPMRSSNPFRIQRRSFAGQLLSVPSNVFTTRPKHNTAATRDQRHVLLVDRTRYFCFSINGNDTDDRGNIKSSYEHDQIAFKTYRNTF